MSAAPPSFPAVAFCRAIGPWAVAGGERLTWFLDEEGFSTCTSWELKQGERLDMILCDRDLRCWRVEDVVDLGVVRPFWERVFRFLMRQSVHRIDQKLVQLPPLSLEEIKERACTSIETMPDYWRDDEAIAGEAGPPREERDMLDELQARVRGAQSVPQLINALYDEDLPD